MKMIAINQSVVKGLFDSISFGGGGGGGSSSDPVGNHIDRNTPGEEYRYDTRPEVDARISNGARHVGSNLVSQGGNPLGCTACHDGGVDPYK